MFKQALSPSLRDQILKQDGRGGRLSTWESMVWLLADCRYVSGVHRCSVTHATKWSPPKSTYHPLPYNWHPSTFWTPYHPQPTSPWVTTNVFSVSMSLFLSHSEFFFFCLDSYPLRLYLLLGDLSLTAEPVTHGFHEALPGHCPGLAKLPFPWFFTASLKLSWKMEQKLSWGLGTKQGQKCSVVPGLPGGTFSREASRTQRGLQC